MRSINYDQYYDKVYGGWIGKCIGGNIGAAVENNKYLLDLKKDEIFPETIPPNDDLDLQLLWLQVLEQKGVHLNGKDLAEAWQKYCWYPFNEYGYFLHNYERKINPPVSGWFNNEYFRNSMGSPIRSEIWGMISIGNAELAKQYAYHDATLDHDTESVWGEQMLAAMEAEAFFESDLRKLIGIGLSHIPVESHLRRCIEFVIREYEKGTDWKKTRRLMLEHFGHPDASKAVQNLGITMLALLYGGKDFETTQLIALNCGYDTDCTCATAGAILGIMLGASNIPEDWKAQAQDTFAVGIHIQRPTNKISDLTTDTCRVGVAVSRSLNRHVRIENIPDNLDVERISIEPKTPLVEIIPDYHGLPAIGCGESKEITLKLVNHSGDILQGELTLSISGGASVSPDKISLSIPAGDSFEQPVRVEVPSTLEIIPQAFVIESRWASPGKEEVCEWIGLAGSAPYYVIGPFWDLYDTEEYDSCPFYDPVHNRKGRPKGAANFNNYVNLDREYIPEDSFEKLPEGRIFNSPEHKIPIDEWIGKAGPICVYLVQDIESPDDREAMLMVGNSDGFKIWVNQEQVYRTDRSWFWMPYNHHIPVKLKKGRNRVVMKLVRRGESISFSAGYAVPETHVRWMNDLAFIPIIQ